MKVYKGFDKNLQCRGFQYEVGKEYETDQAVICERGFHACEMPLDVLKYYEPGSGSRYCEADLEAENETSDDSKRVGKKIRIGAEIGIAGLVKAQIEYVKEHVEKAVECGDAETATAGSSGAATAGYRGAATSRGTSIVGKDGIACARGNNCRVKGGMGAVLVICEEEKDSYDIAAWKAVVVDGENIKPDTFYKLQNGKLVEVKE